MATRKVSSEEETKRRRRYEVTRKVIQAHRDHAEALARVFDKYLLDYYGHPGDDGTSLGLSSVLDEGRLVVNKVSSDPVLTVNHLFPHVQATAAAVVPSKPRVMINPRRKGKDEVERQAIAAAGRVREALQLDVNRKTKLHLHLRRAAAVTALMGHAVLFARWEQKKLLPKFEVLTPLEAWFDLSVKDWEDIRYFIRVTVLRADEAQALVRRAGEQEGIEVPRDVEDQLRALVFDRHPDWLSKHVLETVNEVEGILDQFQWTVAYDFYDFVEDRFSKWVEGMDTPILEGPLPHRYVRNPGTLISFNDNLRNLTGIPDATLVAGMLAQQEELDTIGLHHARGTVPILFVNGSKIGNTDDLLSAYRNARVNDAIVVDLEDSISDLRSVLVWSQGPTLSPSVTEIRNRTDQAIRSTLAIPEYSRGVIGKADVATEVALADAERKTLQAPRAGSILDAVSWAAETTMRFYAEHLPVDETLYARYGETYSEVAEAGRETMRLPAFTVKTTKDGGAVLELADEYTDEYAYEAVPYSGNEGTRFAQLRLLEQWYPILAMSPNVDKRALDAEIVENMQKPHLLAPLPPAGGPDSLPGGLPGGPLGGPLGGSLPTDDRGRAPLPPGLLPAGLMAGPVPPQLPGRPGEDTLSSGAMPFGVPPLDMGLTAMGGPGHRTPFKGPV